MASESVSTLVLFIAAIIVATATAGILAGVILTLGDDLAVRGEDVSQRIASEVRIVNDPTNVVTNPTKFYVQNVGTTTLELSTVVVILDGEVVTTTNSIVSGATDYQPGEVALMEYADAGGVAAGDHKVKVTFENGVSDDMSFRT